MTAPDPASNPRAFWAAIAGVPPEQLIFPPGPSRLMRRLTRWLHAHPRIDALAARALRCWRILWFGPRHPDPAALPLTPLNLAPWTNHLLPDSRGIPGGSGAARLRDHLLWRLSHPHTRFETHAWRCRARAENRLTWRLRTLRNTLAGQPSGPPPWLLVNVPGLAVPEPPETLPQGPSDESSERTPS